MTELAVVNLKGKEACDVTKGRNAPSWAVLDPHPTPPSSQFQLVFIGMVNLLFSNIDADFTFLVKVE
jgi:hypothetical protein